MEVDVGQAERRFLPHVNVELAGLILYVYRHPESGVVAVTNLCSFVGRVNVTPIDLPERGLVPDCLQMCFRHNRLEKGASGFDGFYVREAFVVICIPALQHGLRHGFGLGGKVRGRLGF